MTENGHDLVDRMHREALERFREEQDKGRALVQAMHHEAFERHREQQRNEQALIERIHREAVERHSLPSLPVPEPPTLHYTELPEAKPDSPLHREWNTYRREAGRLLATGQAGRFVLVKGEEIVGLWETEIEALRTGYRRFLGQAFLVHQVQERERLLRCVSVRSCHNLRIPFRQAS